MKLCELLKNLKVEKIIGDTSIEISDVKIDSGKVSSGNLFVALKGTVADGNDYVKQVEKYGGVAVVSEIETDTHLTQIIVKNARKTLSILANNFYGNKSDKLRLIGVVGTNGKTTTSHMVYNILRTNKIKCGLIGTLGVFYGEQFIEPTLTTPDPLMLHKILAEMYDSGVGVVVMEVSAHAIYFEKLYGLSFEVAIFTNFSRDHVDFFTTMENYKNAKLKFFDEYNYKYLVTNSDDEVGRKLLAKGKKCVSYGIDNPSDVFVVDVEEKDGCTEFVINLFDCIYKVNLNFFGRFNVSNAMAAATTCALIGIKPDNVFKGLEKLPCVSGRMEKVYNGDFKVYVDYAHTPDGLEKTISAIRQTCKGNIITVFGCGGNRDKGKREEMGEISGKYSDFTVITSDNPRFEEPMQIIREIEKGVLKQSRKYVIVENREDGIEYALDLAKEGDVVLVAGKGSERHQETLGVKRLYNDKDAVCEIMRRKNK